MSNKTSKNQLVVFLDTIGRTILGNVTSENDEVLSISNPAIVVVQPNPQSGQIQLQILPLFFREFLANRNDSTVWHFKKSSLTLSDDIEFVAQFSAQYEQLFAPATEAAATSEPEVVKLFDDEKK
jgi:hypothetical protein